MRVSELAGMFRGRAGMMRLALWCAIGAVALFVFSKLTGFIVSAPARIVLFLLMLIAVVALFRNRIATWTAVSFVSAVLLYYPIVSSYYKSPLLFFILFGPCAVFAARAALRGKPAGRIIVPVILFSLFAMFAVEIFWPVFRRVKAGNPGRIPGVKSFDTSFDANGRKYDLAGHEPNSIAVSLDGKSLFVSYRDKETPGMAVYSTETGNPLAFVRIGKTGGIITGTDTVTGDVYVADAERGVLYAVAPDTFRINKKMDFKVDPFIAAYADSNVRQAVVPDGGRKFLGAYPIDKPGTPWKTIPSGGLKAILFPRIAQEIPGVWSMKKIFADITRGRYFVVYGWGQRLSVVSLDNFSVLDNHRTPPRITLNADYDLEHHTLFLSDPYEGIYFFDTESLRIVRKTEGTRGCRAIAYDRYRDVLTVAENYSGDLVFIDAGSGNVLFRKFLRLKTDALAVSISGDVFAAGAEGILRIDPERFGLPAGRR